MTTQEQRNIIASETGYADAMASVPLPVCKYTHRHRITDGHSTILCARCAELMRAAWLNEQERLVLARYEHEQRAKEVQADDRD